MRQARKKRKNCKLKLENVSTCHQKDIQVQPTKITYNLTEHQLPASSPPNVKTQHNSTDQPSTCTSLAKEDTNHGTNELKDLKERNDKLKCMANEFWHRWRHELALRNKQLQEKYSFIDECQASKQYTCTVKEIDVIDVAEDETIYLGRGNFSYVKLMKYHGMKVAVKEYYCRTIADDVRNEASIMSKISHPYMPYFFGANSSVAPYFLVMEFVGVNNMSICVAKELQENLLGVSLDNWICMCGQLIEAIDYLHYSLNIVHNGIKHNNALLTSAASFTKFPYNIMLIDFGNAIDASKLELMYHPNDKEAKTFCKMDPHLPMEVSLGKQPLSRASDMYSYGKFVEELKKKLNFEIPALDNVITCCSVCFPSQSATSKHKLYMTYL